MAVPEPEEEHDGGSPLYPHEIIHDEVPALRYLVRLRLIEFQGLAYTSASVLTLSCLAASARPHDL